MKKTVLALLLFWGSFAFLFGQAAVPPLGRSHIIDQAGMLDASTESMLEATIQQEEDSSSSQMVVLTIPSLEGEDIEGFALRAFKTYKLGQKGKDNGVLLVVALQERKVRIEVGYGLEGALPDALCGRIITKDIIPYFKSGNYEQGIVNGVHSVISAIHGEYTADPSGRGFTFKSWHLVIIILIIVIILSIVLPKSGSGGGGTWYSGGYYGGRGWGGGSWGGGGGGWSGGGGWGGGGGGFSGGGGASGGW